MGTRLDDLVDAAGFIRFTPQEDPHTPIDWSNDYSIELNELAKLIINECIAQARDEVQYHSNWEVADHVSTRLKRHFGVD